MRVIRHYEPSESAPPHENPSTPVAFPVPVGPTPSITPDHAAFYPGTAGSNPTPVYVHYPPAAHGYSASPHPGTYFSFPPHLIPFPREVTPSPFAGQASLQIDPSLSSSAAANLPVLASRKRKSTKSRDQNAQPAKKRRSKNPPVQDASASISSELTATICGVGPAELVPVDETESSREGPRMFRLQQKAREQSKTAATDVWFHLRPLLSSDPPDTWPEDHSETEAILRSFPSTPYVGCKLCSSNKSGDKRKWKTWKHGTGMTTCYRAHLRDKHPNEYAHAIGEHGLKPQELEETIAAGLVERDSEPFTVVTFQYLLMKWIVADDESINVMESVYFRAILNYLGRDIICDNDIPHRTKLTTQILQEYKVEHEKIKADLRNALGRISLTTDLWSDPNRDSFMAITAHFLARSPDNRLEYRDHLIAFRFIDGSHSGSHLANEFFKILDEVGIQYKLGQITMDNASNNNTMMRELEHLLRARGIAFHHDGNRLRCFPHVINIAVQAFLAELKANPSSPLSTLPTDADPEMIANAKKYAAALEHDLVGTSRSIVAACRASGQRRRDLQKLIENGNDSEYWKGKMVNPVHDYMPEVQLLRDCETRWSSTFNMIDRVILLHPALVRFLQRPDHSDICYLSLTDYEIGVLCDIHQALEIPHLTQQNFSFERTPTLPMAIPLYEVLNREWKNLKSTIPELSHYISVATDKVDEYVGEGRKTRVYALAMILNPTMKFAWMKEHWPSEDTTNARIWMIDVMGSYQRAARLRGQAIDGSAHNTVEPGTTVAKAAQAHAKGIGRLQGLANIRRSASYSSSSAATPVSTETAGHSTEQRPSPQPTPPLLSPEELAQQEASARANDQKAAECELLRYEADDPTTCGSSERSKTDLVRFWELHEHIYPLLFRVAMDILPAQASSVPCERVFSSSKETCTLRRNNLSPKLMEALQVLKFKYKQEGLSFTSDLVASPLDYSITEVTDYAARELIATGNFEELNDLITNHCNDDL